MLAHRFVFLPVCHLALLAAVSHTQESPLLIHETASAVLRIALDLATDALGAGVLCGLFGEISEVMKRQGSLRTWFSFKWILVVPTTTHQP